MIEKGQEEKNKKNPVDETSHIARKTNEQQELYSQLRSSFDNLICYEFIFMSYFGGHHTDELNLLQIQTFIKGAYSLEQEIFNGLSSTLIEINDHEYSQNNVELIIELSSKIAPWKSELTRIQDNLVYNKCILDLLPKVVHRHAIDEQQHYDLIQYSICSYLLKNVENLSVYLNNVLHALNKTYTSSGMRQEYSPIRLTGKCNKNEIPTIFYNLLKEGKLNSTGTNIKKMLIHILRDIDGNQLSMNTLNDIFNHSKGESRSTKV